MTQTQDPIRKFEQTIAAFNPEGVMDDWRQRTLRVLRAQERVMQGMAAAARLELRFGQECMASRMGLFNGGWVEPGHASQQWAEDMEKLVAVVREISDEMKACFSEAGKLLHEEGTATLAHKSVGAAKQTNIAIEDAGEKTSEDAGAAAKRTNIAVEDAGEKISEDAGDVAKRTQIAVEDAGEKTGGTAS